MFVLSNNEQSNRDTTRPKNNIKLKKQKQKKNQRNPMWSMG